MPMVIVGADVGGGELHGGGVVVVCRNAGR
jgi:hypothetical protein